MAPADITAELPPGYVAPHVTSQRHLPVAMIPARVRPRVPLPATDRRATTAPGYVLVVTRGHMAGSVVAFATAGDIDRWCQFWRVLRGHAIVTLADM
jgi:hypothetical protein